MRGWLKMALAASLTLNLLLVGGFLYQRFVVQPRLQSAWVERALGLDPGQRQELRRLQAGSRQRVGQVLSETRPDLAAIRRGLRSGNADDPALRQALQRLSDRRLERQLQTLVEVIAFRDGLDDRQRRVFEQMSERPGFVLDLLGLRTLERGPRPPRQ